MREDDKSWTLQKHGQRRIFIDRGEMVWMKVIEDGKVRWDTPKPKKEARKQWEYLVYQGYTLV